MIRREENEPERLGQLLQLGGTTAVLLGLNISLDELAVGFTFGPCDFPVVLVIVLIAAQAFILTQFGLRLGTRLSEHLREGAERLAGAALGHTRFRPALRESALLAGQAFQEPHEPPTGAD